MSVVPGGWLQMHGAVMFFTDVRRSIAMVSFIGGFFMYMTANGPLTAIVLHILAAAATFGALMRDMKKDAMTVYDLSCVFWMNGHLMECLFDNLYGEYPKAFDGLQWSSNKKKNAFGFSIPLISEDDENVMRGYKNASVMYFMSVVLAIAPLVIRWKDLISANTGRETKRRASKSGSKSVNEEELTVGATLQKHAHNARVLQCQGASFLLCQAVLDLFNASRRCHSLVGSKRAITMSLVFSGATIFIFYVTTLKFSGEVTLEAWALMLFSGGKFLADVSFYYSDKAFVPRAASSLVLGVSTIAAAYSATWSSNPLSSTSSI